MADDAVVEDDAIEETMTNLEYGIDLDGGTRISAPITGLVAEDIDAGIVDEDGSVDHDRSSALEGASTRNWVSSLATQASSLPVTARFRPRFTPTR